MNRFKKSLQVVKEKVGKGRYSEARLVLINHINEERGFESDVIGLQQAIALYQQELKNVEGLLQQADLKRNMGNVQFGIFNKKIELLEKHLTSIDHYLKKLAGRE